MPGCENHSATASDRIVAMCDPANFPVSPFGGLALSISNVAMMFNESELTLRYYEFHGLIKRHRGSDGVRVYSWADCSRIVFISKCRKIGLRIGEIAPIFAAAGENVSAQSLSRAQEACLLMVERLEKRRKILDEVLAELAHIYPV